MLVFYQRQCLLSCADVYWGHKEKVGPLNEERNVHHVNTVIQKKYSFSNKTAFSYFMQN